MADNQIISNSYLSNNPDIRPRAIEKTTAPAVVATLTQIVGIDIGGTGAESLVTSLNPLPISGSFSLPVGASTEAKQDTGNTSLATIAAKDFATQTTLASLLTELQLKADLLETQPVSITTLPLPSGSATSANQTTIIGHVDGIEASLTSINAKDFATQTTLAALNTKVPNQGQALAAASVPVVLTDIQITTLTPPAAISGFATETTLASIKDTAGIKKITDALPAGTNILGALVANQSVNIAQMNGVTTTMGNGVSGTGVQRVTIASDSTGTTITTQATASNLNAQVVGNVANAATDSGNPIKIGSLAKNMQPSSSGERGPTSVTDGQRANTLVDLKGRLVEAVASEFTTPDNVGTTYNDVTTTATSTAVDCWQYRQASFSFALTRAGTPTRIVIEIEVSLDGTNFVKLMNGPLGSWVYSEAYVGAATIIETLTFPISAQKIRVKVNAVGTTAPNTFTITTPALYLRN